MDVVSAVLMILPVFLSHWCSAQVEPKNSPLPVVMWHGMGMCLIVERV